MVSGQNPIFADLGFDKALSVASSEPSERPAQAGALTGAQLLVPQPRQVSLAQGFEDMKGRGPSHPDYPSWESAFNGTNAGNVTT